MKKYKILCIILIILFLTITLIFSYHMYYKKHMMITSSDVLVTKEILINDIIKINSKYSLETSDLTTVIRNKDSYYKFYRESNLIDGHVMDVKTTNTFLTNKNKYVEVEAVIDVWLYVLEHKFEFDIEGISFSYQEILDISPRLFKNTLPCVINLSKDEFIEIYNSVDAQKYSRKDLIKVLSKSYVEQTGYRRNVDFVQPKYY